MRRWLPFQIMLAIVVALLLMSLQLAAAQTNTTSPTATVTVTPVITGQTVAVRSTDTLAQLALSFNKPVACLQRANNLDPTNFSLAGMTTMLIPDDCNALLASFSAVTPTPETAESLTTATFTPVASPTIPPTATATATPFASVTATPTPSPDQTYTVVYGDRLAKIADKFGLTVACIAITNSIANPDLIYVGQQLRISSSCTGGSGGGGVVSNIPPSTGSNPRACQFDRNPGRVAPGDKYTVQAGDSLDFIACDFGIQLQCLKTSNPELESSLLMPGDTLNINFSCPIWQDSTLPGSP